MIKTRRSVWVASTATLIAALAVAAAVFWFTKDGNETAAAAVRNACASMKEIDALEFTQEGYYPNGQLAYTGKWKSVGTTVHVQSFSPDGVLVDEMITAAVMPDGSDAARASSGASGSSSVYPANLIDETGVVRYKLYTRGSSGGWTVSSHEWEFSAPEISEQATAFCGQYFDDGDDNNFVFVENQVHDGVTYGYYTGTVLGDGGEFSEGDESWEYWIKSDGYPWKDKVTYSRSGNYNITTYHNWHQGISITIPELGTATPAPNATPIAGTPPAATATRPPNATVEPTATPVPTTTATPVPPTGTPEPDPATATPVPPAATATPVPPTAPVPSGLTATASGSDSIVLSWTPLAGASRYGVYRQFQATSDFPSHWGKVSERVTSASYTVTGLACGTTYHYGIAAYGDGVTYAASWSASYSAPVSATTGACDGPGS